MEKLLMLNIELKLKMKILNIFIEFLRKKILLLKFITFVKVNFLENVKDYIEGDIVVNSKEEKMLLE